MVTELKKLLYILALIGLCSCEVIHEDDRYIRLPDPETERVHVLLEFTGFRCVNCPTAAQTAEELHSIYGDKLITIALHPASNPFTQGVYDYTCPAADSVYRFMEGNATTPFPKGNIDWQITEGSYFTDPATWGAQLSHLSSDTTLGPALSMTCEPNASKNAVTFTVNYSLTEEAKLAVWLVEDSVLGVQAMSDGSVNMAYYHRHMLRNAAFDQPLGIPVDGQNTIMYEIFVPEGCDINRCSLVAILLDKNYSFLNAYEKKILIPNSSSD